MNHHKLIFQEEIEFLTATKNRHRISNFYAQLSIPDSESIFYAHMGHSGNINQSEYQSPAVVAELTKVGKFLKSLDSGEFLYITLYSICKHKF